jgi:glycosyltransferase involved in cell wall biosynthesis
LGTEIVVKQIIGIVLVRNEDLHVESAIRNVVAFCDRLILCDHQSTDGTLAILERVAAAYPHLELHRISHPWESHELIKKYAGTDSWIFAVDGDEIYDAKGLELFRNRLLAGEMDQYWMIVGNVMHCDGLDLRQGVARGYAAPPCRSITKLYNFAAISSWEGDTKERLHGGKPEFLPGYHDHARWQLGEETPWDESPLRRLHPCLIPRSSLDGGTHYARENIIEIYYGGIANRVKRIARRLLGKRLESDWKRERYARGPRLCVPVSPFFCKE